MSLRNFSAIARPVDPRFPTNRAIAALTLAVIVGDLIRRLVGGSEWLASTWAAGGIGLSVFLAWALCREIDPDRDLSAFVAAGLALVGGLLWGTPGLAVVFWLLWHVWQLKFENQYFKEEVEKYATPENLRKATSGDQDIY